MNMQRFQSQVVIVTGSGSGIGEATALRFADEGAKVVLTGRTQSKLERVAAKMPQDRILICPGDVSDPSFAPNVVQETLNKFGKIDVLVNNAAVGVVSGMLDQTLQSWREVMAINVEGVMHCTKAAMPHLLTSKGSVVNVSSVSGLGGDWGMSAYNASKGAISNYTRSLALEFGGRGVRINAVAPSFTRSDMTAPMFKNKALLAKMFERIPMGRAAEPAEVAAVIVFLASTDAAFVNGVNLPVDGGVSASNGQPAIG